MAIGGNINIGILRSSTLGERLSKLVNIREPACI